MKASNVRKMLISAAICTSVVAAGLTALTNAQAAPRAAPVAAAAADMPSAVETFDYPGAAQLLAERGITLKRGDGHLVLTDATTLGDCQDPSNLAVESRLGVFCFKVLAKSGYLSLELPKTFNIWTQDHPVRATLDADGKETVVNAAANNLTGLGESGDTGSPSVLVELRITG
ncbi:hypothetical protein ACQSMD_31355 [Streptomyces flavovirens]|uniref:hypothetical protein n=1 Tax=Streptomyces flavovirens TaxID=52258 RepID=UPI003D0DD044